MKTIHRYDFVPDDVVHIDMPKGARILSVEPSDRLAPVFGVALWALVDTDQSMEVRHLYVHGTGHPLTRPLARFVGTVNHGRIVWHVFEPAPLVGADADGPE